MRLVLPIALLAAAVAHANVSVDARALAPHTPLGPACDSAIAAAQARFSDYRTATFHVRERRVVGEYQWSDMCGVWGNYSLELAPDPRPSSGWLWHEAREENVDTIHKRGTLRANGWRARFILDGDNGSDPGDHFVESFQPAAEICLASAVRPR